MTDQAQCCGECKWALWKGYKSGKGLCQYPVPLPKLLPAAFGNGKGLKMRISPNFGETCRCFQRKEPSASRE